MHTICQNLNTDEEVASTADSGFDCTMCQPYIPPANGKEFLNWVSSSVALALETTSFGLSPDWQMLN